MSQRDIQEMLDRARELQNAGRTSEAASIFQEVLAVHPNHVETLYLYSLIAGKNRDWPLTVSLIQRAIAAAPNLAILHATLGLAYSCSGQTENAVESYRKAVQLDPNDIQTLVSFGNLLVECKLFDEALHIHEKIINRDKNSHEAYFRIGNVYLLKSLHQKALEAYSMALRLKPDHLNAMNGLGVAQMYLGLKTDAYDTFIRALGIFPESVTALNNLGLLDEESRNFGKAYDYYSRAAIYQPNDIGTLNNLSRISALMYDPEKALEAINSILKLDPMNLKAHKDMAFVQGLSGDMESSLATFRKILSKYPKELEAHSNMIFSMHYLPSFDPRAILDECATWSEKFECPILSQTVPPRLEAMPEKKLRIGFVSPDLYHHPVGRSLLQLFANHDSLQYDIYCYSNSDTSDHITSELQNHSSAWHNIKRMSDLDAANLIRKDQIDILVDLSLHSGDNRLLIFAHRPAPIQMSYLGYPSTTGLKSMDYRISDRFIDPENEISQLYSEETLYITSYWCYSEPDLKIPIFVNDLPALKTDFITFGCLNTLVKVSNAAMQCWMRILKETPNSRLLVYCPGGEHRKLFLDRFQNGGVAPSRIELVERQAFKKYLESYHRIDICLDPFPYGGGITTCDAMWMGVPVVSLKGKTAVGRGGASVLSNVGMPGLIANTQEEYISIAKNLAADREGLAAIRKGLREKLEKSPVMDGKRFADEMGHLFRQAWLRYCQQER